MNQKHHNMKKINLMTTILAFSLKVFSNETPSFKPLKGNITTQVGFSLSTLNDNISSLGLNGRYFIKDKLAFRSTFTMFNDKSIENFYENPDGSGSKGKYTDITTINILQFGIEKHFMGNKKLSPYFSFDIGLGAGKNKINGENSKGSSFNPDYKIKSTAKVSLFNLYTGLGFDYWITDGLYIGAEYTFFQLGRAIEKEYEEEETIGSTTTKTLNPENVSSGSSTVGSLPFIKLGWRIK